MITITEHALHALGFEPHSAVGAVQAVRSRVTKDDVNCMPGEGVALINKLLGTQVSRDDLLSGVEEKLVADFELMTAQAVAETIVRNVGIPVDEAEVLAAAKARVARLMSAPQHHWMFVKGSTSYGAPTTQVAVVEGLETKVAVKADGSIKKGGKEVLAAELYHKYVASLNGAEYSNQAFIAILVKELGMTKSGATTYNYNCKKKFGGQIAAKK